MIQHFIDGGSSVLGSSSGSPVAGSHLIVFFLERLLAILIVIRNSFIPSL
jgi:hypothetical protein